MGGEVAPVPSRTIFRFLKRPLFALSSKAFVASHGLRLCFFAGTISTIR